MYGPKAVQANCTREIAEPEHTEEEHPDAISRLIFEDDGATRYAVLVFGDPFVFCGYERSFYVWPHVVNKKRRRRGRMNEKLIEFELGFALPCDDVVDVFIFFRFILILRTVFNRE